MENRNFWIASFVLVVILFGIMIWDPFSKMRAGSFDHRKYDEFEYYCIDGVTYFKAVGSVRVFSPKYNMDGSINICSPTKFDGEYYGN